MDGEFSLRRVRTNIWREEKAGHAGGVSPAPSRGDGRKSLHKSPLAFHIFHHCGLLSKLWFPLFERLTTREDAKVAVSALAHVRRAYCTSGKHANMQRRDAATPTRASPGRWPARSAYAWREERGEERERPFRATLLFALHAVSFRWQSVLGTKEELLCFTICAQKRKKQGHMSSPQHPQ